MKKRGRWIALVVIGILAIILAGAIILTPVLTKNNSECKADSDCMKVQTGCCPCSSGGGEKCVPNLKTDKLETRCDEPVFCAQVYNCNIEKCVCVEGKCTG